MPTSLNFSDKQLQSKFKHGVDFGIIGNYNSQNALAYHQALLAHINAPDTYLIQGTYHRQPVLHYFNPTTNINVIFDLVGNFVSGWELSPAQVVISKTIAHFKEITWIQE